MLRLRGTKTDPPRRDGPNAAAALLVTVTSGSRTSRRSLAMPSASSLSSSTFPNVFHLSTHHVILCYICIASSMLSHRGITNDHGGLRPDSRLRPRDLMELGS
jgi:hypothetical protein